METTNFQFEILEDIAFGESLDIILGKLVSLVEAQVPDSRCSILLLDHSSGELTIGSAPSLPDEYNQAINGTVIGPNAGACGAAAYLRQSIFIDDISTDPRWEAYRDLAATHGLVACWSTPIVSRRSHLGAESSGVLGTFAIYPGTTGMPNQSFVDLMRRAQHLACLALESDFVKKTEAKLARQSDLLTKAETVVGLGSFEWELSSNKLTWSDHLYKIFGYHESSRPARLDLDFFLSRVHPEDRDEVFAALQEALTNRTGYRNQERIVRPDGEVRIIESFGEVQCDSMGKPTHLAGGCLDITERQELERRLAQSQKMDAIKRLAGGIAHDFNNLLTIITGQAAELMEHGDNPLDKEALGDIWEAGRRAAALTSRLLDFSETKELTATVIDLKVVVRNTLRLARRALSEAITVQESYPDESALISANESQIEQLVFNLLLNAGEAMPEGGRLRIDLSAPVEITTQYHQLKPGTFVELRMQDTGRGIEEELLQKIFEPFSTSKKLGDGRGLGLAVAHGTVCRWGGHIEFLPSVGTGTVVRILFPRVGAAMFETALPATGATHNATATVLVVDDEHAVRRLVEKMLTRSGFKVMQAKNAGDALEIAQKCAFDLLVTDIVMPGMRGDHLARKIRDTMPQIPVLLMSGYAQDGFNVGEPNQDARMRFVSKPFDSDSFLSVVRELLT